MPFVTARDYRYNSADITVTYPDIVQKVRPVHLNLLTMRFPIPAIVSITHRISGIILFLALPWFVWLLQESLASEPRFQALQTCLQAPMAKSVLLLVLAALTFHLVAGLRHLMMDMGVGESLRGGVLGARLVFVISALVIVGLGVWLW